MSKFKMAGRILLATLLSMSVLFLVPSISTTQVKVGFAKVTTSISIGKGKTLVNLPPLGEIEAKTHSYPLELVVRLDEVDIDQLDKWSHSRLDEGIVTELKHEFREGVILSLLKALLWILLCYYFIWSWLSRSKRVGLISCVIAVLVTGIIVFDTVSTYDQSNFQSATYRGSLRYAPMVMRMIQTKARTVKDLQKQAQAGIQTVASYYDADFYNNGGDMKNTFRVLVVSDMHLDLVGFQLEEDLANQYKTGLVINAGDVNNSGSLVEGKIVSLFLAKTRQLFIPGNHDSRAVVDEIRKVKQVTVLDDDKVEVDKLKVYGLSDPASRGFDIGAPDDVALEQQKAAAEKLGRDLASGETTPNVVVLHSPVGQKEFADLTPLVVSGHTHVSSLFREGDTWYLNPGTIGDPPHTKNQTPHSAAILYYTESLPRRLIAIDMISFSGDGRTELKRQIVDESLLSL